MQHSRLLSQALARRSGVLASGHAGLVLAAAASAARQPAVLASAPAFTTTTTSTSTSTSTTAAAGGMRAALAVSLHAPLAAAPLVGPTLGGAAPAPALFSTATDASSDPAAAPKPRRSKAQAAADTEASLAYSKLDQRSHVLLRPEPYVGSVQPVLDRRWLLDVPSGGGKSTSGGEDVALSPLTDSLSHGVRLVERDASFHPALFKLFDEVAVNAADNVHRSAKEGTPMTRLDITIDAARGEISVANDGAPVPLVKHATEGVWVPELIFGTLLTSSNYNDNEQRFTGGRHGYGAKLANIFSTAFSVHVVDAGRGLTFKQTWRDNMAKTAGAAKVTETPSAKRSQTKITFTPDLARFPGCSQAHGLPRDLVLLMRRRALDLAVCLAGHGVAVTLNGVRVPVKSAAEYLALCPAFTRGVVADEETGELTEAERPVLVTRVDDCWEVAVSAVSEQDDAPAPTGPGMPARHVSFVNAIATAKGGTHVMHVTDQVARHVAAHLASKRKKYGIDAETDIPLALVRARMAVFVNCRVPNPTFDAQTKDELQTPIGGRTGVGCVLPDAFLAKIVKSSGVCEAVAGTLRTRAERDARRKLNASLRSPANAHSKNTTGNARKVPLAIDKLDDANLAGTEKSRECTLILTEGDSAKALAVAGLSVVGRERFGVFPLRGKLLNVRDASEAAVAKNKEVTDVARILGLRFGADYSSAAARASLRYGRVMLMADQDHDGSHIKGLFLNMIHCFWPSLLVQDETAQHQQQHQQMQKAGVPGTGGAFMHAFVTPIIKAIPHASQQDAPARAAAASSSAKPITGKAAGIISFYSLPDYYKWKGSLTDAQLRAYRIKYYKGLGTSTAAEGRAYFSELKSHVLSFAHEGAAADGALDLAFNKARADERKRWLLREGLDAEGNELTPVLSARRELGITEFVHRELVHFSRADTVRSIPSLVDGLKPGQRKVLYACFKRRLTKEIKVAQLAGYVAEHTGYHHGEQSLNATIVNMAQDFPGAHNLPLLQPLGQFGTRHMGGKDAASARYIFTKLQPYTRLLFRPEDDAVLTYRDDDGDAVEPHQYVPVIPLVLVNGAEGIGTGFSTSMPTFHPLAIIDNVRARLAGRPMQPMLPWSWGFTGSVWQDQDFPQRFWTEGKAAVTGKNTVEITELPWGTWTGPYKTFLTSLFDPALVAKGAKGKSGGRGSKKDDAAAADDALPANTSGFCIQGLSEHHSESAVRFTLSLDDDNMAALAAQGDILDALRLRSSVLTSNMHLFDDKGVIGLYSEPLHIIESFFPVRLALYGKRREAQLRHMRALSARADDRRRFIECVMRGELVLARRPKADIVADLVRMKFRPAPRTVSAAPGAPAAEADAAADGAEDAPAGAGAGAGAGDFEYLLSMPLSSLTQERVRTLQAESEDLAARVRALEASTPASMWDAELAELQAYLTTTLGVPSYAAYLKAQPAGGRVEEAARVVVDADGIAAPVAGGKRAAAGARARKSAVKAAAAEDAAALAGEVTATLGVVKAAKKKTAGAAKAPRLSAGGKAAAALAASIAGIVSGVPEPVVAAAAAAPAAAVKRATAAAAAAASKAAAGADAKPAAVRRRSPTKV